MKRNLSPVRYVDLISDTGVSKELNFLPAPSYFYEYLYREIPATETRWQPLTLIKILIRPRREFFLYDKNEIAHCENSIINFAKALNSSIRQSDFAMRIGRYEFLIALDAHYQISNKLIAQEILIWQDEDYSFSYSSSSYPNVQEEASREPPPFYRALRSVEN